MASIVDDRGYNQGFVPTKALEIRTDRRCQALLNEMSITDSTTIIELGCGTGALSDNLAARTAAKVIGVDICMPFIEEARRTFQRPNLSYEVLDLKCPEQLAQLSERCDYVVGNGILHHLYNDLDFFLERMRELLKPGGKIIFWEPNLLNPYVMLIFKVPALRRLAKLEPDEMAFTGRFIRKKLHRAGFARIETRARDFLLPNTPDSLIKPVVKLGDFLERVPAVSWSAQSVFISATRES